MKKLFSFGQTVAINEMQMYYVAHGQGEPLVLLHGYTGSSGDWELFLPDLAQEYRLIIPDLRGHGRSTNPLSTFTYRQAALDVFALLNHLGIDQFKAIGLSGGGNTLLHMATQQADRVGAMALVSAVWARRAALPARRPLPGRARPHGADGQRLDDAERARPVRGARRQSVHDMAQRRARPRAVVAGRLRQPARIRRPGHRLGPAGLRHRHPALSVSKHGQQA